MLAIQDEFAVVFHKNKNRIYYYLHQLRIPYTLHDEFYAEGMYAMWLAYTRYEKGKGSLSTYLNYQIRFRLIDLIRKKERENRDNEHATRGMTLVLHDGNRQRHTDYPLVKPTHPHLHDHSIWHYIKHVLTERQWKWVYYYVWLEMPLKDIASQEGVTVDAVKSWAKEARRKLRQDPSFKRKLLQIIRH